MVLWPDLVLLIEVVVNCLQNCVCRTFSQQSVDQFGWNLANFWTLPRYKIHKSVRQIWPQVAEKKSVQCNFEGNSRQPKLQGRGLPITDMVHTTDSSGFISDVHCISNFSSPFVASPSIIVYMSSDAVTAAAAARSRPTKSFPTRPTQTSRERVVYP